MYPIYQFDSVTNSLLTLSFEQAFSFKNLAKPIISFVGAGGKSTLITALAKHHTSCGKKVLVTTSTHIWNPGKELFAGDYSAVEENWAHGYYAVIGTPLDNNKLAAPDSNLYKKCVDSADIVLIEADGAKGYPCKIPNLHEPVIFKETNIIIGVCGLDSLHQSAKDVCFRYESLSNTHPLKDIKYITTNALAQIIQSDLGTMKNVQDRECHIILNKCDDAERKKDGLDVLKLLTEVNVKNMYLTTFKQKIGEE